MTNRRSSQLVSPRRYREDELIRLLDIAIWGFVGEPQRCSRCGCERFIGEHSPTCPMPAQVIGPANLIIDRRSHGRVTNRRLDMRLRENRPVGQKQAETSS